MKLLVTGCRGFLGGSIGRFAARAGHQIVGVGRSSQPPEAWPGEYRAIDVSAADLAELIATVAPDIILHAAGTASVKNSIDAPLDDLRAAVWSFANLLDGVRQQARRPLVIFPSSAAVYGEPAELPVVEGAPVAPLSPYGFHKAACELFAREYAECFGLPLLVCRFFSLLGPAQRRLLVWELHQQVQSEAEMVRLQGTGEETRDYLGIEDAARCVLGLAARWTERRTDGLQLFNVASGTEIRVAELALLVGRLLGKQKQVLAHGASRPGDPQRWQADVTRLRAELCDWQPESIETALTRCFEAWDSPG